LWSSSSGVVLLYFRTNELLHCFELQWQIVAGPLHHREARVGVEWAQYLYLMARHIKASTLLCYAEFANPHQAGTAYIGRSDAIDTVPLKGSAELL